MVQDSQWQETAKACLPLLYKVAHEVLAQREQIQFMSITQLADECGVADATISRFCRSRATRGFRFSGKNLPSYIINPPE